MNQNQNIHIWVLPNGSKATMSILSKEITRNDIDMAISLENIVFGICNDEIDAALDRIHSSGEPQHNIVIAKEEVIQSTLLLANRQSEATPDIIRKITDHFRLSCSTLENMKAGKSPLESTETIFVLKDQKFCTISIKENNTDIFGKQVHNTHTTGLSFSIDGSIVQNRSEAGIEYIAKKEGYLVALSSGKISIADPVSTNVDKMCFLFHFMPVWWNLDALFNYYLKISQQKISDVKTTVLSDNDLHEIISSGKCSSVVVRSGRAPIAGKDAVLTFLVHNNSFIHQRENGSVDFKELSKFQYIKGGTILAEKTRPVPGIYGVNALGERITVNPPLDITFNVGINVIQKEENEKNYYIASCDGILNLQDHFIEILDVLRISGDVGPQTGNIHSEKDVFISGNVLGGFSIESKGSIIVDGCIENGATIVSGHLKTLHDGHFFRAQNQPFS